MDQASLEAWWQRWKVAKLELFGSARFDLATAHHIDLLVTFLPDAEWGLFDHVHMEQELSDLTARKVRFAEVRVAST